MPGVLYTEPFRSVPARLRHGSRSRQTAIMGLPATPRLNRVIGQSTGVVELPPQGLVLSSTLGEALGVEVSRDICEHFPHSHVQWNQVHRPPAAQLLV